MRPIWDVSRSGLAILSRETLEEMGEMCAKDYQPGLLRDAEPLRAEGFAQDYLKLDVEFQWLSNDGCYLGAAVLGEEQRVVLYDPQERRAYARVYGLGTVLLDATLAAPSREGAMRFTLLHECAHQMLHRTYFSRKREALACRSAVVTGGVPGPTSRWTDLDWMEWQANCLASSILMPRSAVRARVREQDLMGYYESRVRRGMCESRALRMAAMELAPLFRVSERAAEVRLKALGFGVKQTAEGTR